MSMPLTIRDKSYKDKIAVESELQLQEALTSGRWPATSWSMHIQCHGPNPAVR